MSDIDECTNLELCNFYNLRYHCVNVPGQYYCDPVLDQKSRNKIIIIGISTGIGLLFMFIGGWWSYKVVKKRKNIKRKEKFFKRNGGLLLQQQLSSSEVIVEKTTKLFSSKDLEKATDNFNVNRILGQGGQGTENNLFDIIDARVMKDAKQEEIIAVANLAKMCLNIKGKKRPTMKKVAMQLEAVQTLQKTPNVQQNHEVFEYARTEMYKQWDAVSTSTMSGVDSGVGSSSGSCPLNVERGIVFECGLRGTRWGFDNDSGACVGFNSMDSSASYVQYAVFINDDRNWLEDSFAQFMQAVISDVPINEFAKYSDGEYR
ncbi:wall-associated receptor kinase-like 1 [Quercus suber]|uniref:Wall-associated receptor kinase-like 1 n=1 Tax=Quercus suber TaxID=58331 RepID=A0AAW0MAV2_QUESU